MEQFERIRREHVERVVLLPDGTREVHVRTACRAAAACPMCGVISSSVKGNPWASILGFADVLAVIVTAIWLAQRHARKVRPATDEARLPIAV